MKLSVSSFCVSEASWKPPRRLCNQHLLIRILFLHKQKLPEADTSRFLRSMRFLQLQAAGLKMPSLWAGYRCASPFLTGSPDKLLTPTHWTDWGVNIFCSLWGCDEGWQRSAGTKRENIYRVHVALSKFRCSGFSALLVGLYIWPHTFCMAEFHFQQQHPILRLYLFLKDPWKHG